MRRLLGQKPSIVIARHLDEGGTHLRAFGDGAPTLKGIRGGLPVVCCLLMGAASPALATTGSADLSVTKSDSPDPVAADSDITYTVTVHNAGPDTSIGVQLS